MFSFNKTKCFCLSHLPNLETLVAVIGSLINVDTVVLKNIPNLKNLDIKCAFKNCKSKVIENASLLGELPCWNSDVILSLDDLNNVSDGIEGLVIGNGCFNELNEIDFSRFVNVRMIDIGDFGLQSVNDLIVSSEIIDY